MSAKPWYPRYPRDFRAKTVHLNLTERGAYDALIDHYYELQSPLPCDPESLYRIAGAFTKRDRDAVDRVAREFFTNGDGRLTNTRCEEELAKMRARSEQQSELANRRWHNAKAYAKALPSDSQGNASHSHSQKETSKPIPHPRADKPRRVCLPVDFELSPSTLDWCQKRKIPQPELQARYDWFKDYARSSGKQYADWQAAFKNSVRGNWANITPGTSGPPKLAI